MLKHNTIETDRAHKSLDFAVIVVCEPWISENFTQKNAKKTTENEPESKTQYMNFHSEITKTDSFQAKDICLDSKFYSQNTGVKCAHQPIPLSSVLWKP